MRETSVRRTLLLTAPPPSSLEGSNQIVSDQGVRKNLYQKVRHNTELVSWQGMGMG